MQGHYYLNDVVSQAAVVFEEKGTGEVMDGSHQEGNHVLGR